MELILPKDTEKGEEQNKIIGIGRALTVILR